MTPLKEYSKLLVPDHIEMEACGLKMLKSYKRKQII